ncbi:MAG: hypothetical protein QOF29_1796 [bacterium]
MTIAAPSPAAPTRSAVEMHRRQREMVAASLHACPGATRSTHRRWA